ncbi:hypothetical protein HD806DRAFT_480438 [Xylariaceae sp. AK1471]|nr:hypothetical protein HD806DRAFT_480438 [Xylariaceae sp. AK1471]
MFSKVILAAAAIGAVTAQVPAIAKREFIENRQDDGLDPACESALSAVMPLYSELPTPPADLLSMTLPADPCVTPSFTGKLGEEWSSYTSEALQWYSSHSDELNSIVTACSDIAAQAGAITGVPVCTSGLGGLPGATTSAPAQTTSESGSSPTTSDATKPASGSPSSTGASSSGSPSTSSVSTGAAPRETGFVVAAAAAAVGFMGAIAVL